MKKILKICGWGALAIVLLFALILLGGSPLAKHIVNNYGEQIVGRQLHADQVIINPFWGGVTIKDFQCKEQNGETDFVSFGHLYVQIAWPRLIAKNVTIRAIHLDYFNGQVLKEDDRVNFSDIIERFAKKDTVVDVDTTKSGWTVLLKDIRIRNSNIRYRDIVSGKQWKLEDLSLHVPGLYFDNTQSNAGIEFGLPTGGRVGIAAGLKMQSNRYAVRVNLYDVHTDVVLPLVQDYLNVSGLGAIVNGSVHVDGSLDVITNILLKGHLALNGLSLRDTHNDEVAALDELRVVIDKGDVANNTYVLDSLMITGLTANYEVHEGWNTVTRLLKTKEEQTEEATSDTTETETPVEVESPKPAKPFVWMAKHVTLNGHDIMYHDYSQKHNWEYGFKTLRVDGTNVAGNGRNNVHLKATLPNDAQLKADVLGGMDLKHQDGRLDLKLTGVQLTDFDALCRNYTGYPLEGGILSVESHMEVVSGKLKGNNTIEINQPRVGKKERFTKAKYKDIPVRMGFKMLTSAQDMILLDVPVYGDATNPKFDFGKVIGRAILKVFFGPLMGVNDKNKSISKEEMAELQELLSEDTLLGDDATSQVTADVAVTASDSVGLTKVGQ